MNNKFKRFNKILMMTVAILLCFVLISTSVVSGIFAKYVITKSAGATVSLKKFGVTLSVNKGDDLPATDFSVTPSAINASTLSVTVTGSVAPGDVINEAVKFTITANGTDNKPNVSKINLKVAVTVSGVPNFAIEAGDVTNVAAANYIPLSFTSNISKSKDTAEKTILAAWNKPANNTALQNSIAAGIEEQFGFTNADNSNIAEKIIWDTTATTPTPALAITYLGFGFASYGDGTSNVGGLTPAQADAVQSFLAAKSTAPALTVTYTVSLEQVV